MANREHIKWLVEGVEAWNARRRWNEFVPDLQGFDFFLLDIKLDFIDLSDADMRSAKFESCNLYGANLSGADLRGAYLQGADLRRAYLQRANLREANLREAIVRTTVNAALGTNDTDTAKFTDLSLAKGLTQQQIDSMDGDSGTILPEGLTRLAHWPEWDTPETEAVSTVPTPNSASDQKSLASLDRDPTSADPNSKAAPYVLTMRERPLSEIRTALSTNHATPAALAQYMVDQLQRERATQAVSPKPNTEEGLAAWHADTRLLKEMLLTVQTLHAALPTTPVPEITDELAHDVKDKLIALAEKIQQAIAYLDNETGTYGNFWRIGLIGVATNLLMLFGCPMPIAAPISAGVIGVNTLRVYLGRDKA